jgi:hypothetical protein
MTYTWVVETETKKIYYKSAKDVAKRYDCSIGAIFKRLQNENNKDTRVFGKDKITREKITDDGIIKEELK